MGKLSKKNSTKKESFEQKKGLADELESLKHVDESSVNNNKQKLKRNRDNIDNDDEFIDAKLSNKILNEARKQQLEFDNEEIDNNDQVDKNNNNHNQKKSFSNNNKIKFQLNKKQKTSEDDDDDDSEDDDFIEQNEIDYYNEEDIKINEQDEKIFDMFMSKESNKRRTIADIIMEKLTEKKTELQSKLNDEDDNLTCSAKNTPLELDERVIEMYKQIKDVLSKYRSGKLPKAFKIIPSLNQWEYILYLTEPDRWSAAAMYQATRIFSSNLNAKMAQRFYNLILLPRIRDDISEYKRLNFHLYMSIRKSLFKPAAFFKGVLLPLCESGTCTLREAIIIGSILSKQTIPMLHSAACLLKLAEMDYAGSNSIFIKILLDKKYALPYRVIDSLVNHFVKFTHQTNKQLPVLWHQSLITFVQRYKQDLSSEQKEALLELIKVHTHKDISKDIRYELINSKTRDVEGNDDEDDKVSNDMIMDY